MRAYWYSWTCFFDSHQFWASALTTRLEHILTTDKRNTHVATHVGNLILILLASFFPIHFKNWRQYRKKKYQKENCFLIKYLSIIKHKQISLFCSTFYVVCINNFAFRWSNNSKIRENIQPSSRSQSHNTLYSITDSSLSPSPFPSPFLFPSCLI